MKYNKVVVFILCISLFSACKQVPSEKHLQVKLSLSVNAENTPVKVNRFTWEHASIVLELKDENNRVILMPSPPMPPSNLADYDMNIKASTKITFPILGLNVLSKQMRTKDLKIRCVGFYQLHASQTHHKAASDWVMLKKNS